MKHMFANTRRCFCEHQTMSLRTSKKCLRRLGTQSTSRFDIRQRAAAPGAVPPPLYIGCFGSETKDARLGLGTKYD